MIRDLVTHLFAAQTHHVALALVTLGLGLAPHAEAQQSVIPNTADLMQRLHPNTVLSQRQVGGWQSPWQDISLAPADFPVPLISGRETKFMKLAAVDDYLRSTGGTTRQLTLTTKDASASVRQWYQSALPSRGFQIDNKYSVSAANRHVIRAASDKLNCVVSILERQGSATPETIIQISVAPKPQIKI